jgi:arsenate reductase (thioredoxin)
MQGRYNVLFLCTGNSARSIMAEAIMNRKGFPNFTAYSAGSHPKGAVHPAALRQLELAKLPITGLRSKDWNEFAGPVLHTWTLFLRSATTPLRKYVPFGPDSP